MTVAMTDLWAEHQPLMPDFYRAFEASVRQSQFIGGGAVRDFEQKLGDYMGGDVAVIGCANGTDALQVAYMALDLKLGDEVIIPNFNYIAAAEAAAVLGLVPVLADVCGDTFNITAAAIAAAITHRTRAVVVVHLFGQCADMQAIVAICAAHNLFIIEDAAQSLGATYTFDDGSVAQAGTMGIVGTTSFFPTKNLGGLGDGGAIFTKNAELSARIKSICNHGQMQKYVHQTIGTNSRLDTLQAAFLCIKLQYLTESIKNRQLAADFYTKNLCEIVRTPHTQAHSTHTYNQYTIRTPRRNELKAFLESVGVATMVYYPTTLGGQAALHQKSIILPTPHAQKISTECLSLPISSNITTAQQIYICQKIKAFFR